MNRATKHGSASPGEIPLDRFLGREVVAANHQRAGRIEEIRAEKKGADYVVTECVIGAAGLVERMGIGVRLLFGWHVGGYVASWDQIDISDPDRPRLTCSLDALRKL